MCATAIEHPLGGVALLAPAPAILLQPLVDELGEPVELRATHLRCAPIPRRHGEPQLLPHALVRNPEMPCRPSLAHPLPARQAYLAIQVHGMNPPPSPSSERATLAEFYSAAAPRSSTRCSSMSSGWRWTSRTERSASRSADSLPLRCAAAPGACEAGATRSVEGACRHRPGARRRGCGDTLPWVGVERGRGASCSGAQPARTSPLPRLSRSSRECAA